MQRQGRICSLFPNEVQPSKLLVAGSIPVSRSMFSIAYTVENFPFFETVVHRCSTVSEHHGVSWIIRARPTGTIILLEGVIQNFQEAPAATVSNAERDST